MNNLVGVYNPTNEEFSVQYDVNGDGNPVTFTLKAMDIEYFDPVVAEHIKKHLADKILYSKGKMVMDYDKETAEIKKKLEIKE